MRQRKIQFLALAFALLLSLFADTLMPEFVAPVDHTLSDWRTRTAIRFQHWLLDRRGEDAIERRFIIVDIDEKTFNEQGAWPWRREKVAELLRILTDEYQVASVALDIVFPEVRADDNSVAKQMAKPVVTGAVVYDLLERRLPAIESGLPKSMLVSNPGKVPAFLGAPSKANHPNIMPKQVGHITPIFDSDGTIRHLPPVICDSRKSGECRPLLEIVAYANLFQSPNFALQANSNWFGAPAHLVLSDGEGDVFAKVPLRRDGAIVVPYRHHFRDWTMVSATDILKRRANADILRGTIVLLGSTALGMGDVVSTPVRSEAAGLEPHAEVLSALFENNFLYEPKAAKLVVFVVLLAFAALLIGAMKTVQRPFAAAFIYPVWMIGSILAGVLVVMLSMLWGDLLLPVVPFFLFPFFAVFFCVLAEYYRANKQKLGILNVLSTYLPRQVARHLSDQTVASVDGEIGIDASQREMTVLFADIRGFTGLVEKCSPELVATIMHRVFTEMANAVVNHGGTIDKFIGDAVMAFWNAPDEDPNHAMHAFEAALEMVRRIDGLAEFCDSLGVEPVTIGIGIETGATLVGHFGSSHRRTYTALGETVVLASRIEGLSLNYDRSILVGPNCALQLDQSRLEYMGRAKIRGRQQLVDLFAPKKDELTH
ncbi:adenylate/guanylate cyclase domain-containing protein [Undibacterium cyanobacteriorum]|uniref:Adenylate/guanylate cyclase domain-containing protein n=1 Tax=Undibacterium cyanobacteriorum TaxID=3073561 RepID=A0ABY9RJR8_9BURK|nr:adenylate/guanylate cyclase domain-containing protein [Undibacterium sp. 20NA77.5]WMW81079.1 adenylate/guanylate cyclase domain-containing protein [Undibacterium sp. 20NA77.5]